MAEVGQRQRQILTANLLSPVLAEAEERIIAHAVGSYKTGKLTGEQAIGVIGELTSLRSLRQAAEGAAKRANME